MSFLQPLLLLGLPLIGLPIIIHLVNQQRYQTMPWGAMLFLLAANRMSRGFAKLRQWLILAARTLAVAGLLFGLARPLASGWLGLAAGNRTDTTIILLDQSPSMGAIDSVTKLSKLEAGKQQLVDSLEKLRSDHWVLISSVDNQTTELTRPADLLALPAANLTSAAADMPAMLLAAYHYIQTNQTGKTDIWMVSDMRNSDWSAETGGQAARSPAAATGSGRWGAIRDSFAKLPQQTRFFLVASPQSNSDNLSIQVTEAIRDPGVAGNGGEGGSGDDPRLLLSLSVHRGNQGRTTGETGEEPTTVPIEITVDGARSVVQLTLSGELGELKQHPIPLAETTGRPAGGLDDVSSVGTSTGDGIGAGGWGMVSIPADTNVADNVAYFVYDQPAVRRTLIVTESPSVARPLRLAAEIPHQDRVETMVEVISPGQFASAALETIGLIVWHAELPDVADASLVNYFLDSGGVVMLLPPVHPNGRRFHDFGWQTWQTVDRETHIADWRGDADLLANTQSGAPLPVGSLQVNRRCGFTGDVTRLASLSGQQPLLGRIPTTAGGLYVLATTPDPSDSSLAADGVVFYVMMQRALATGSQRLERARQESAGRVSSRFLDRGPETDSDPDTSPGTADWTRVTGGLDALSHHYDAYAGVYRIDHQWLALNRPITEDDLATLTRDDTAELFRGLDFVNLEQRLQGSHRLIQEIWRLFLMAMLVAMVLEAALCLPKVRLREKASVLA